MPDSADRSATEPSLPPVPTADKDLSHTAASRARPDELTSHDPIVRATALTKRYGDFLALDDCNLQVTRGQVFGLLGPNGAGKTTLIRLMLGFLQPTAGSCEIDGHDSQADSVQVRRKVAYLPGDARLPRQPRGKTLLRMFAEMHPAGNLQRSEGIADRLELDTRSRVGAMSTGMRQKLALAITLGLETPLVILDEPTANLDPTVRATVLAMVCEAQQAGRTVLFSSHVLGEIEETCHRVVFLRRGRLVHQLTMADLFQRHRVTATGSAESIVVPESFRRCVRVESFMQSGQQRVRIDTAGDLAPMLPWLHSLQLRQVRIEPLGLRAVYDAVHAGSDASNLEDEV